jgi:membrane protease YdiL (CAAX protease family)
MDPAGRSLGMKSGRAAPWLFILSFFVLWIIRLYAYKLGEQSVQNFFLKRLLSDGWRVLVWVVLPIAWLALIEQRPINTAFRPLAAKSPRMARITALALIALIVIGYRWTYGHWTGIPSNRTWDVYTAVLPGVLLVGLAEELVFRGVFFSGLLQAGWSARTASLLASIMFTLSHWPAWLIASGPIGPVAMLAASTRLAVFGLVMNGLVILEGGLLLAIIVHAFNDLWVGVFF